MNGVTTAIVAFLFTCVVIPSLVKNRVQWYAGLWMTLAIILIDSLAHMIGSDKFSVLIYAATGFLQAGTILILVLACGGLTARELAGDMGRAFEVIRRGETEKEVIIPLSKDAYQNVAEAYSPRRVDRESPPASINAVQPPSPRKPPDDSSVPLA